MSKAKKNLQGTVVMAFGTFDFFHAGHLDYLKQAKKLADRLVVVVARDETVHKVKGQAPRYKEKERLASVKACPHVDEAILGYLGDKYRVLKQYKPKVIALGYDQFAFTYKLNQFLIKEKMATEIVRLKAFHPQTFKSSLLKKIQDTPCDLSPKSSSDASLYSLSKT